MRSTRSRRSTYRSRRLASRKSFSPHLRRLIFEPLEERTLLSADLYVARLTPTGDAAHPFATLELQFSQAVAEGSFTSADVSVSGAGTPAVSAVNRLAADRYSVTLTGTGLGTYCLTVGPDILSATGGLAMNQDHDAIAGEAGDAYMANLLSAGATIAAADTSYDGEALVIYGNTVTVDQTHSFASVEILGNATVRHTATTTSTEYKIDWTVTDLLWIASGSQIDVSNRGYTDNRTLGNTTTAGATGQSGGSYGGSGFDYSSGTTNLTYGDYRSPNELGSGGAGTSGTAGSGGGLVQISAATLTLDGSILANGEQGHYGNYTAGGSGSGGGIVLNVGTLSGSGTVAANGGAGNTNTYTTGSGGGGRIAIYYDTLDGFNTSSQVTAHGGTGGSGVVGSVGTVYLKDNAGAGVLRIDSHGTTAGVWTPLGTAGDSVFVVDQLVLSGAGVVAAPQHQMPITANQVTIANGATLTHRATTTSQEYSLQMTVAGTLSVDATSQIDVSERGYTDNRTLGNTTTASATGQSGGSYGGTGYSCSNGVTNDPYGKAAYPNELGSGGAGSSGTAGAGGGLVQISAATLTLNGSILANGEQGHYGNYTAGGSGSGGGIVSNVGTLSGSGTVAANGGAGNTNTYTTGSGGGGRVAVYYHETMTLPTANIAAAGGSGGAGAGTAGSRFFSNDLAAFWFLPEESVFHGTESLTWGGAGLDAATSTVDIVAYATSGMATTVASGMAVHGGLAWNTTAVADGRYELRAVFRDANSQIVGYATRTVLVNNGLTWHTDQLTASQTWAAGTVHAVEGTLVIPTGVVVTIEPGATVKFTAGAGITVQAGGTLAGAATESSPIILTSLADDTAGGDSNHDGANSLPERGDWTGIANQGTLNLSEYVDLRYTSVTHGGTLTASQTWSAATLHLVTSTVVVPDGVTLTIEAGAQLKFSTKTMIDVRSGGRLVAEGTTTLPIAFTSIRDDAVAGDTDHDEGITPAAPGDWLGIFANGGLLALDHVTIDYAGGTTTGVWAINGAVRTTGSAVVTLANSSIRNALFEAIMGSGGGDLTVTNTLITGAGRAVNAATGSTIRLTNCTLDDNGVGIYGHQGILVINNSIISNSLTAGIHNVLNSPITLRYSDVWSANGSNYLNMTDPTGTNGNVSVDPLYKNRAQGNYRLAFGSPVIDSADGTLAPTADAMGASRYDDPRTANTGLATTGGSFADMGVFEFVENASSDVDLVVSDVQGPSQLTAGETVRVTWSVANLGAATVTGSWHDALCLAPESVAGNAAELLVAQLVSTATLGPGLVATFTADVSVPAGAEGTYRWKVRANCQGEVYEGALWANNALLGAASTTLSVPPLELGTARTGAFAAEDQAACFKLAMAAGQNVVVSLDSTMATGSCRIYASYGTIPTTAVFDLRSTAWNSPDATLELSTQAACTVYLLVVPETIGNGGPAYSLLAQPAALALDHLGLDHGGNAGLVTVAFWGSHFESDLAARLQDAQGHAIEAVNIWLVDSTCALAQFDLCDAATGVYNALVEQDGLTRSLASAFTVTSGIGPALQTSVIVPATVRAGRTFTGYVEYVNIGDADMDAPLLTLRGIGGSASLWAAGGESAGLSSVEFLGVETGSPLPGVLSPGVSCRFAFCAQVSDTDTVDFEVGVLASDDTQTMDYDALLASITPAVPHELWSAAWQRVVSQCGTTRGSYILALEAAANRAASFDLDLTTEQEILTFLVREACEAVQTTCVGGTVYLGDTAHPLARKLVMLTPIDPTTGEAIDGDYFATSTWYDGSFGIRNVAAGTYALSVEGYLPGSITTVTLTDPVHNPVLGLSVLCTSIGAEVSGYVTEGDGGQPIADAMLSAISASTRAIYQASTAADGSYQLTGLPADRYTLEVAATGWYPQPSREVTLAAGQSVAQSFSMTSTGGRLSGVVRGPDGNPVAGAVVFVGMAQGSTYNGESWCAQVVCDTSGCYELTAMPVGTYEVIAAAEGYAPSALSTLTIANTDAVVTANLSLATAIHLVGTVIDADTRAPIADAHVATNVYPWLGDEVLTDASGRFTVGNLGQATYQVIVQARGYLKQTLEVALSSSTAPLAVELKSAGVVQGQVTSAGQPVANAKVTLLMENGWFQETCTNAIGHYEFSELELGDYDVAVGTFAGFGAGRQAVTISEADRSADVDFQFNLATIAGRTLAADGQTPLANVLVCLVCGNELVGTTTSDSNGEYQFFVFQSGTYDAVALNSACGFAPRTNLVLTQGLQLSGQDLLAASGTLSIRITALAGGAPLPQADVVLHATADPTGQLMTFIGRTAADGTCHFTGLPAGQYTAVVTADSYSRTEASLSLTAGANICELAVHAGRKIQGVVTAAGVPLAAALVQAGNTVSGMILSAVTDDNGRYELTSLPEGVFDLLVKPPAGYQAATVSGVDTRTLAEQQVNLVISEASTATITGQVTDGQGLPVADATVVLATSLGGALAYGTTDQQGQYALRAYPSGDCTLVVLAEGYLKAEIPLTTTAGTALAGQNVTLALPLVLPCARTATSSASFALAAVDAASTVGQPLSSAPASIWHDITSGTFTVESPNTLIENLPAIQVHRNEFIEQMVAAGNSGRNHCNGVVEAYNACVKANELVAKARDGWQTAYDSMKNLNQANLQLVTTQASMLGAMVAKAIFLGTDLQNLVAATPGAEGLATAMAWIGKLLNTVQCGLVQGDFSVGTSLTTIMKTLRDTRLDFGLKDAESDDVNTGLSEFSGVVEEAANLYEQITQMNKDVLDGFSRYLVASDLYYRAVHKFHDRCHELAAAIADCKTGDTTKPKPPKPQNSPTHAKATTHVAQSHDPNDKVTVGFDTAGWITDAAAIPYTIHFENVATASAAAQEVVVTDQLSANLDWSTFELVGIGFNDVTIDVPAGLQQYSTRAFVGTDSNPVDVSASFDPDTGRITWRMASVEAVTGELPEDPLAGFLPPNDAQHHGEGYVSYRAQPVAGLASGTTITNQARIVFDANSAIDTNETVNTIDAGAPTSAVAALPERSNHAAIVSWSGSDSGSGVARFEIYVSDNGGPYSLWHTATAAGTATYDGPLGHTYSFYCVATDNAGHRELAPLARDAQTTIQTAPFTIGLYDPATSLFHLREADGATEYTFGYGQPGGGWIPLVGDWDGDGQRGVGLYDPCSSHFYLTNALSTGYAEYTFGYGEPGRGWTPLVGDWDGDGRMGVGLYDPHTSCFYLTNTLSTGYAEYTFGYGEPGGGWTTLVGDWNADGHMGVGLYDPHSSYFYLTNALSTGYAEYTFGYGEPNAGWTPLVGDWNGDATTGVGLYDPSASTFYLTNALATGFAEHTFGYGVPDAGWTPLVGDWNGDATMGVALYDPAGSIFYLTNTLTSGYAESTFGYGEPAAGWIPLTGSWQSPGSSLQVDRVGQSASDPTLLVRSTPGLMHAPALLAGVSTALSDQTLAATADAALAFVEPSDAELAPTAADDHAWPSDANSVRDEDPTCVESDRPFHSIDPHAVDQIDLPTLAAQVLSS
jgi:hypothetical protein